MNEHEHRFDSHPDDDRLERFRAGLLDGTPEHEGLAAHLAACETCRLRLQRWQQLVRTLFATDGLALPASRTWPDVARARRVALEWTQFFPPLALAATLAALAVGLTLVISPMLSTPTAPPLQTVEARAPAPDLLADLDFYLWLSSHQDESSPRHGSS